MSRGAGRTLTGDLSNGAVWKTVRKFDYEGLPLSALPRGAHGCS